MLSFKTYIEEHYIDWDCVFDYLTEAEDEFNWNSESHKFVNTHNLNQSIPSGIPGKGNVNINVNFIHNPHTGVHEGEFSVGGEINAQEGMKRLSPESRMAAMHFVAKAMRNYATNKVEPGEKIKAMTSDKDMQEKKEGVHTIFFTRLARSLGENGKKWDYQRPSLESMQPYHILTKPAA